MEISENLGFMYGQNFKNFSKYVRIAAGMHRKSQILFGLPIRRQKNLNLFGLTNRASKIAILLEMLPDSQTATYCGTYSNHKFNHSVSIPSALLCLTLSCLLLQ